MDDPQKRPLHIHIAWSEDDQQYVATTPQYPSLSWLSDTRYGALEGLEVLIASLAEDVEDEPR